MKQRRIENTDDAAAALRALAGGKSIRRLADEHAEVTRSLGAWCGWLNGKKEPKLKSFLRAVKALGGEVLISRR